jgi:hypothetical protein
MSEHQKETAFLRHTTPDDDGDECYKLKQSSVRVRIGERFVQSFTSVIALLIAWAIIGAGVSVAAMLAFAGRLMDGCEKLKRLRDARRESCLGKPGITTVAGSYRGSDGRESFKGAAKESRLQVGFPLRFSVTNRLCG